MGIYQIADVTIGYQPQSDYTDAFLADYRASGDAQLTLAVLPTAIEAEASRLPCPHKGVQEAAAVLRALARCLPSLDRLVLHAATVVYGGNAYAFIAPSGTGKTTHAALWGDRAAVLNGDKLFLHLTPHAVTAYGNPWRGKEHLGYAGKAPLKGLFVLSRGTTPRVAPLSPADALPHLLRAVPYPPAQDERLGVLSLLERLVTLVPLYHLEATPTVDTVDAVIHILGGTP